MPSLVRCITNDINLNSPHTNILDLMTLIPETSNNMIPLLYLILILHENKELTRGNGGDASTKSPFCHGIVWGHECKANITIGMCVMEQRIIIND